MSYQGEVQEEERKLRLNITGVCVGFGESGENTEIRLREREEERASEQVARLTSRITIYISFGRWSPLGSRG
jgi:hypothetical protein